MASFRIFRKRTNRTANACQPMSLSPRSLNKLDNRTLWLELMDKHTIIPYVTSVTGWVIELIFVLALQGPANFKGSNTCLSPKLTMPMMTWFPKIGFC